MTCKFRKCVSFKFNSNNSYCQNEAHENDAFRILRFLLVIFKSRSYLLRNQNDPNNIKRLTYKSFRYNPMLVVIEERKERII